MAKTKQQVIGLNNSTTPVSPAAAAALQQVLAKGGGGTPTAAPATGPFATGGGFQEPAPITRPASAVAGNGTYSPFATVDVGDIPQSFVDEVIQEMNGGANGTITVGGHRIGAPGTPPSAQYVKDVVEQAWDGISTQEKQRYQAGDQQKIAGARDAARSTAAGSYITSMPQKGDQAINEFYTQHVIPAIQGGQAAVANQPIVDRQAEADLHGAVGDYTNSLNQYEGQRMAGIQSTNAKQDALVNDLWAATNSTNAENKQLASQFIPMAQSTSAANSGLAQQLMSAAQSTNANQTGLFNTLSGQASSANSAQNAALSNLLGNVSSSNAQQNQNLAVFQQQFAQLNAQDQKAYLQYLSETDPLMAKMIAQGSDPADVASQRDVVQRYKDLSTPEVTGQERLIAELARRKFEADDKSSRDAVMQQLAGRGLKSGGLVIANQQQTAQQLGQDRSLSEMELQANAVGRSMDALQGYAGASNALRNADDAMRNFQDQYAQNDAVRRGNLATQRNQQSLATTGQVGARDAATYDAATQTVNDNFGRNVTGYNAQTQTINDNYGRDRDVYAAGTQTNQDNYGRTSNAIGTNIGVNSDNYNRNSGAVKDTIGVNSDNFARTSGTTGTALQVNADNDTRYQTGLDRGETAAGNIVQAKANDAQFRVGNAASEAGTATGWAGTMAGIGTGFAGVQTDRDRLKYEAVLQFLGLKGDQDIKTLAAQV